MNHIKKGSIVVRKSHLRDVIFKVVKIFKTDNNTIALLRGLIERVEADSPIDDLELVNPKVVKEAYDKYVKLNNNGKGKLTSLDINLILEQDFRETYIKSGGIWYMSRINLLPEAKQELEIYDVTNF